MSKRSRQAKKKPLKKPVKAEFSNVKPIKGNNFHPEQLKQHSNKKLLVTALTFAKKSKNKVYSKEQRRNMRVVAQYIIQILQERGVQASPAGV